MSGAFYYINTWMLLLMMQKNDYGSFMSVAVSRLCEVFTSTCANALFQKRIPYRSIHFEHVWCIDIKLMHYKSILWQCVFWWMDHIHNIVLVKVVVWYYIPMICSLIWSRCVFSSADLPLGQGSQLSAAGPNLGNGCKDLKDQAHQCATLYIWGHPVPVSAATRCGLKRSGNHCSLLHHLSKRKPRL